MSKVIAIALLIALTLFPNPGIGMSSPGTTPNGPMVVTVLFSGLMVFNENPVTGAYEVGILDSHHSEGHQFCVRQIDTVCRQPPPPEVKRKTKNSAKAIEPLQWLPTGTKWKLTVTTPPNDAPYGTGLNGKRRPDTPGNQHDFDWIVTLGGDGFPHTKPLTLKTGQFKPIIQLPKVKLFAKYKSPDFVRWQGDKPTNPDAFGFVAETIGFTVKLKKDEELVLKDEDTGTIVVRQPYIPPSEMGGNSETIYISNSRYPKQEKSDFRMYYDLFSTPVPLEEQYDFALNTKHPCEPHQPLPCEPLNPLPKQPRRKVPPPMVQLNKGQKAKDTGYKTCCDLVCTPIRLTTGAPLP